AIYGFLIALFFSFFIGKYVMNLITAPVKAQLDRFYERRVNRVLADKKGTDDKLTQAAPFRKRWYLRQDLEAVAKGKVPSGKRPVLITPEQAEREANPPSRWRRWFNEWVLGESPDEESPRTEYNDDPLKIPVTEKDKHLVALWVSDDDPLKTTADGTP